MTSSKVKEPVSKKQAAEAQREREEIERINDFLDGLYQKFFEAFANQYPNLQVRTPDDIPSTLKKLLNECIFTRLGGPKLKILGLFGEGKAANKAIRRIGAANQAIRARFYDRPRHRTKDFPLFIWLLETTFLGDSRKNKHPSKITTVDRHMLYLLARALQDTVFAIPRSIYGGIERISREVQERLIVILQQVDAIGKYQGLSILPLSEARTRLYQEIAQVDGFVWFPLRSLSSAPLTSEELPRYCVGRSAAVDKLARHIVKNNGVILVAGYRGVGKSTFVNAVEARLPEFEKRQELEDQWHIVTVKINLAKVSGVISVLRLCIRNLYHKFLVE